MFNFEYVGFPLLEPSLPFLRLDNPVFFVILFKLFLSLNLFISLIFFIMFLFDEDTPFNNFLLSVIKK